MTTAHVPGDLVSSVVDLVDTGPVLLGAYTSAELTAVDAVVDFLEARPTDEVLAEAVRSLAARELLVASDGDEQLQVRGDLGIAVAFQQRARTVLDARVSGTKPGEPWRMLLLPQPEPVSLLVRIDALGVHDLGLFPADDALDQLVEWLPRGDYEKGGDAAEVVAASERSALVTVVHYTSEGSAETAGDTDDLVLARRGGDLYAFGRDEADRGHLVPRRLDDNKVDDTIKAMLVV
ncbi:hypothetical protein Ais01nite_57450 [Asanoa ishikariensis]|uniref:EspG family protein n=1 Tax=Asanoa ishikariensis TaxID=137265 RepID=A0A1H3TYH0_9ACTN|nr:hypothetical protein [Asanoa ishikariensis]GIF67710.1 hypothetical protein Ais01nite_57450 [Asanoa ishikariensis]SDZ55294.1 hypothetical protein SAMN05421684_6607 [Asanoa ishikariensis]